MERSLHKYRAYQDDRGRDAKNFQAIVSHTQSVGRSASRPIAQKRQLPFHRRVLIQPQKPGPAADIPAGPAWSSQRNYCGGVAAGAAFFLPIGDAFARR